MKMRSGWWVGVTLAALWASAAATALRPTQVEDGLRPRRRFSTPVAQDVDSSSLLSSLNHAEYSTIRSGSTRAKDDFVQSDTLRTRTKSRPTSREYNSNIENDSRQFSSPQVERNERFTTPRNTYIRTRKKPIENKEKIEGETGHRESFSTRAPITSRNRQRQGYRITSQTSLDTSARTATKSKEEDVPAISSTTVQFRPRSRGTTPMKFTESTTQRRYRGRVNTRATSPRNLPDHITSGSTITENIIPKNSSTINTSTDIRNSRKLRYKTRLSESDTNLTGLGVKDSNEVIKSSQNREHIPSQEDNKTSTSSIIEEIRSSTENINSSSPQSTSIQASTASPKRKINFRPSVTLTKSEISEISEDDNYPESFKALLQAKKEAPQPNSRSRESLSVKASQKIYKTHTHPLQSTNTDPERAQKFRRFYKQRTGDESKNINDEDDKSNINSTLAPNINKTVTKPDFRNNRTPYLSRSRKTSTFVPSTSTSTESTQNNIERNRYKYNRKFKAPSTESSKERSESKESNNSSTTKKSLIRTSYYSRLRSRNSQTSTEKIEKHLNNRINHTDPAITLNKGSLKRPHLSRLIVDDVNLIYSTESNIEFNLTEPNEHAHFFTNDKGAVNNSLKYFQGRNINKSEIVSLDDHHVDMSNNGDLFANNNFEIIIPQTFKKVHVDSNEVFNKSDESENIEVYQMMYHTTTPKYHSSFKDENGSEDETEMFLTSKTPPIRNIHTRKYARRKNKEMGVTPNDESTTKHKEINFKKYTDSFMKTSTAIPNDITPEPDKLKGRFSSKYRGPIDRPMYKATVPSVTSSTAWLKFYVTDRELTKPFEEPEWFDSEEQIDLTTTPLMRHYIIATSPIIHDSSDELVEGEESELGPDMNAISFSQTRSTLSSADLKLSETVLASSHLMNFETLHHSPSVTVSIFDALADILTSTPKPQLPSTTEVIQKTVNNDVLVQTLNGVSNKVNVNSLYRLESQETFVSTNADLNTSTKSVQITDQTTPIVINRILVGEDISLSVENQQPEMTPRIFPVPTPTTPVSARKPFAIKVLYSNTELPIDNLTTAPELTPNWPPTSDNPAMVYNTVSDLILLNNNLVSSELTSMLSNNIKSILQNMDAKTRSKLSGDMTNILKRLIPRALDGVTMSDDDFVANTTPYSLEEIRDTEILEINNIQNSSTSIVARSRFDPSNSTNNLSQTIRMGIDVNITNTVGENTDSGANENVTSAVNSSITNIPVNNSFMSESNSQLTFEVATLLTSTVSDEIFTDNPFRNTNFVTSSSTVATTDDVSSLLVKMETDVEISNVENSNLDISNIVNRNAPVSILTDIELNKDKINDENIVATNLVPLTPKPNELNVQEPGLVSSSQLWLLSKKARVLKLIEDLIQQHNIEIATAASSTIDDNLNPISSLSERLTQMVLNMNVTVNNFTNTNTTNELTRDFTDVPNPNNPTTQSPRTNPPATNQILDGIFSSRFSLDESLPETTSPIVHIIPETLSTISDNMISIEDMSTSIPMVPYTKGTESATNLNIEMTTVFDKLVETTTRVDDQITTSLNIETTIQNELDTVSVQINSTVQMNDNVSPSTTDTQIITSPKKDFVIFGILPNNTVVRKDPNDNVLETLTEASPYIIYGVLPNNTIIRKFPNGTRVPRVMQKIDVLPISPWSLRNPYSPIHNNPAIVKPRSNPIRVSTNVVTSNDTSNNGSENRLTTDTVNNNQDMISTSTLNINNRSSFGITTVTNKPAETSTASHVLSLRTTTMLPSVDEILLNSISSAAKEDMVISSMSSSTREPRILTLDIDPETKQIRTEKPDDGMSGAVFKFIPIDEVSVSQQDSNVQKLASTKSPGTTSTEKMEIDTTLSTETNTQTPQITLNVEVAGDPTTTTQVSAATPPVIQTTTQSSNRETIGAPVTTTQVFTNPTVQTIIPILTTLDEFPTDGTTSKVVLAIIPSILETITTMAPISQINTNTVTTGANNQNTQNQDQADQALLNLLLPRGRSLSTPTSSQVSNNNTPSTITLDNKMAVKTQNNNLKQLQEDAKLLEALLIATGQNPNTFKISSSQKDVNTAQVQQTTPSPSFEDDIKQFEEDTKLLKALLQATGQNPDNFKLPTLNFNTRNQVASTTTTTVPTIPTTTTTARTTTPTTNTPSTTPSIEDDIRKFQQDAKLLQALLQATGQNPADLNVPIISGVTSNVRVASNPLTTSIVSNVPSTIPTPTVRPVFTSRVQTTTNVPTTVAPLPISTTLQSGSPQITTTTTSDVGISTTFRPYTNQRRRLPTSTVPSTEETNKNIRPTIGTTSRRLPISRFTTTTEIPSTSTFSVEEDLVFLQNLKSALNTNSEDAETALANRVIALAVERSLNEIQNNKQSNTIRSGKAITNAGVANNILPTSSTTSTTTTTTFRPTTRVTTSTPSIEDDIRQFEEDTKLLQALLKATGQDPSKFNIPTITNAKTNVRGTPTTIPSNVNEDLKLLGNLLASPSPLNEPFDSLTQTPSNIKLPPVRTPQSSTTRSQVTPATVKNSLKNLQDDPQFLQTLIQLQGKQETTTQKNKLAIAGLTGDEALSTLLKQTNNMASESTKSPLTVSTEYGKSNDALLAALLKEQGFGPTTASSLDEQLRLAALLNQVVVTPKARRTTTTAPPPAPRRPVLDGLAWLWQQWRDTEPGPPRQNRRPAPTVTSSATSNRVNWFGSGPFVGNAPEQQPSSNRIPLEPPRAVAAEQTPGRGQLVSAAINVTRAFSQFLGAAIQGAAQTVQNVIRAGQKAATDVYTTGSG